MCGIGGIVYFDSERPVREEHLNTMNQLMLHRGPDACGTFVDGPVGLAHRRLKIIDLEGGVQPMYNDDQSIVVVFNGEVYNFQEIRKQLIAKGHQFKTHSDTEVIIRAYEEYGDQCVEHFRGMFAIALFDRNKNRLLIIRDRLGIKPIYYYADNHQLVFASEVKPVIHAMEKQAEANTAVLDFYMTVGYVPGEPTFFKDIQKLLPGHLMIVENGKITTQQYWDLQNTPTSQLSFDEAMTEFDRLIHESVDLRMISDVPVGAFLSGGLDSSAIVSLMSERSASPIKTFSVGYKDQPESSELGYAKIVADHFKTEHHEYVLDSLDFFQSLDMLLNFSEEPIVEQAAVPLYQLSMLAKEHVTVILSGEGGDEILAGYPLYQISNKVNLMHRCYQMVPKSFSGFLAKKLLKTEKQIKYFDWIKKPVSQRYKGISNDVTGSIKEMMYQSQAFRDEHKQTSDFYENLFNKISHGTDLRKMTYADIKSWLPDDLLVKADKMTMAASLELRVPLLDHKLMEFCVALPDDFKIRDQQGKYLLKKYMESKLPHEIIYRKKKGFPVPIAEWFRTTLHDRVKDILLDKTSLERGYFNPQYIEQIFKRHKSGQEDLSRRIFSMLTLELWHQKYLSK